jgi:hypothetical protein
VSILGYETHKSPDSYTGPNHRHVVCVLALHFKRFAIYSGLVAAIPDNP